MHDGILCLRPSSSRAALCQPWLEYMMHCRVSWLLRPKASQGLRSGLRQLRRALKHRRRARVSRTVASVPCRSALSKFELSNVRSPMKKDVSWSKLSALWSIRPDHATYSNDVLWCRRGVCVVQALAQSSLISWVVLYHLQKSRHRVSLRCSAQCDLCMLRGCLSPPPKTA